MFVMKETLGGNNGPHVIFFNQETGQELRLYSTGNKSIEDEQYQAMLTVLNNKGGINE